MKNVLLLCLSPVKANAELCEYTYITKNAQKITLSGYTTNEAPAKSVIDGIARACNGEKLDKVVVICSDLARKPVTVFDSDTSLPIKSDMTHIDFYMQQVNSFATERDSVYRDTPIEYTQINVKDHTDSNQISVAAIDAAKEILALNEDGKNNGVRLYIDYNGGQRYFSLMLLAISSLLKPRGVKLTKVLAMNYESRIDDKIQIQNLAPIFGCMDLTSAINEYVNYGRTRTLNQYFEPCIKSDPQIAELLKLLTDFAHDLLLCRTSAIESSKGVLMEKLVSFSEKKCPACDDADLNAYRTLFEFVVNDVRREMMALLCGSLPEMILWCVDHDYLQQALTFFTELFPDFIWETGILRPTENEERDYLEFCEINREYRNEIRKAITLSANFVKDSSSYRYNWFIKYLSLSSRKKDLDMIRDLIPEDSYIFKKSADINKTASFLNNDYTLRNRLKKLGISKVYNHTVVYILSLIYTDRNKRIFSPKNISRSDLSFILTVYFVIKDNRNATNHASDEDTMWDYDEYIKQITACANELKKLSNKK